MKLFITTKTNVIYFNACWQHKIHYLWANGQAGTSKDPSILDDNLGPPLKCILYTVYSINQNLKKGARRTQMLQADLTMTLRPLMVIFSSRAV